METNSPDEQRTIQAIQQLPKLLERLADGQQQTNASLAIIAEQLTRLANDEEELREGLDE